MKTKSSLPRYLAYAGFCAAVGSASFWAGRVSVADNAAPGKNAPTTAKTRSGENMLVSGRAGNLASDEALSLEKFLATQGRMDGGELARWAKSLSPAESAAALAHLQGLAAGEQRDELLGAVIDAWAERDPQGFLATTDQLTVPRLREDGMQSALRAWAAKNPQEALTWLQENPGAASSWALRDRYTAAIEGFALSDPGGALRTVAALGEANPRDAQLKRQAFQTIAQTMAEQGHYTDALGMFAEMPQGQTRNQAFNEIVQRWSQASPSEASAWVQTVPDPQERQRLAGQVTQQWAQSDPAAAATWAAQMDLLAASQPADPNAEANFGGRGAGGGNNNLLSDAIRSWARYDLDAPAGFLNQVPAGPTKDNAVATFALRASQEDPAGALQWVGTINDPQMRQNVALGVAAQMLAQDPASFNTFVNSTNLLTDQQKQQLQTVAANVNPNQLNWMLGGGGGRGGRGGGVENFFINGGLNDWLQNGGQGGFGGRGAGGGGGNNFPQGGANNANPNVNGQPQRGRGFQRGLNGGGQVQNGVQVYTPGTQGRRNRGGN